MSADTKIGERFSRVADNYEQHAVIQRLLAEELLDRVGREKLTPHVVLDIGCGTGRLTAGLKSYFPSSRILGLDISHGMAKAARAKGIDPLVADAADLPFKAGAFDLVVSNVAYQWVSDLARAFQEVGRVLKNDGLFMLSCFGAGTLDELRCSFGIEESPLPSTHRINSSLKTSGFHAIELEVELQRGYFESLVEILYWLKSVGANRTSSTPPFLTPRKLALVDEFYCHKYRRDGKVYATFEVIWATARKGPGKC